MVCYNKYDLLWTLSIALVFLKHNISETGCLRHQVKREKMFLLSCAL
jgi:hypothetical protein